MVHGLSQIVSDRNMKMWLHHHGFIIRAPSSKHKYAHLFKLLKSPFATSKSLGTSNDSETSPFHQIQFYDPLHNYQTTNLFKTNDKKRILICGDGDLSFGASLALGLRDENESVNLIVSVLESETDHKRGMLSVIRMQVMDGIIACLESHGEGNITSLFVQKCTRIQNETYKQYRNVDMK